MSTPDKKKKEAIISRNKHTLIYYSQFKDGKGLFNRYEIIDNIFYLYRQSDNVLLCKFNTITFLNVD